jgi:hypothetical protein
VHRVTFRYPEGSAPAAQVHRGRFPPGAYRLVATLTYAAGRPSEKRERTLEIEREGRAFLDLQGP